MTDGYVYYLDNGIRARRFSIRDGQGIKALQDSGIQVWLVSGESDLNVYERADKLGVEIAFGLQDKRLVFRELSIPKAEIAYMGDDTNDIPAMELSGLPACPFDAHKKTMLYVVNRQGYVCHANGGDGAVREFCDWVLGENRREAERDKQLPLAEEFA